MTSQAFLLEGVLQSRNANGNLNKLTDIHKAVSYKILYIYVIGMFKEPQKKPLCLSKRTLYENLA